MQLLIIIHPSISLVIPSLQRQNHTFTNTHWGKKKKNFHSHFSKPVPLLIPHTTITIPIFKPLTLTNPYTTHHTPPPPPPWPAAIPPPPTTPPPNPPNQAPSRKQTSTPSSLSSAQSPTSSVHTNTPQQKTLFPSKPQQHHQNHVSKHI